MISIITVSWNSYDFLELLIESLEIYSSLPYELIVVDNSSETKIINRPHVHQFFLENNMGHGYGLNYGCLQNHNHFPNNPYIMFLDVDCHMLKPAWEIPFIKKMEEFDLIGGRGVPAKPIRPACMFMKKKLESYDWQSTKDYHGHRITPDGFDVAILAYHKMCGNQVPIGFLEHKPNRYGTLNGEEWCIDDVPLVYHHWHGASLHLTCRQADFPGVDLMEDKRKLFYQIPWRLL